MPVVPRNDPFTVQREKKEPLMAILVFILAAFHAMVAAFALGIDIEATDTPRAVQVIYIIVFTVTAFVLFRYGLSMVRAA